MTSIVCPCCGHERHLTLQKFSVAELARLWTVHFGFDPFVGWTGGEVLFQFRCVQCSLVFHSPEIYGDDAFYARLSQHDWYYESEKWEFDVALDLIRRYRPTSLLEVGCGSGEFLQKVVSGVDSVMGVDINPDALARAIVKGLKVTDQPLANLSQTFDMVVLFEVLEHLPSPSEMLAAMVDRLNPGGTLVIAVPNPDGYLKDQGLVLLDLPPHHSTKWSRETFAYIGTRFGLQEVTYATEPLRYVHYQAYMAAIIASGTRRRSVRFLQQLAFKALGPFLFDTGRDRILGQTHLVALRKPA